MRARLISILAVAGAMAATALFFGVGTAAAAITVNCPGDDLQSALDNAPQFATITINGTCYGNFAILGLNANNSGDLTLQGGSAGATLNGKNLDTTLGIVGGEVTIRNLTITNGNAGQGGGIYVDGFDLTMVNVTVKGNRADRGGGILALDSELDLTGVTITRNTARYQGGGIDVLGSFLSMTASTISSNTTTQLGIAYGGGGIRMSESNVLLTNTKVTTNRSADYGGGIADYGACRLPSSVPAQQIRCLDNVATVAGKATGKAIVLDSGLTLVNSSVDHNVAALDGGGIYNESQVGDSPISLQGTTVSFNNAVDGDGGGIANYGECGNTASVLATKSTFQGNQARAGDGGAVYNSTGVQICVFDVTASGGGLGRMGPAVDSTALVTVAQSPVANGPNVVNSNQARHGAGFANEQDPFGIASLTLQPGAKVTGNKASVTGGGVWNDCGSFSSLGQIMLNTPNNVVNTCLPF